jgi:hypothetical protein
VRYFRDVGEVKINKPLLLGLPLILVLQREAFGFREKQGIKMS